MATVDNNNNTVDKLVNRIGTAEGSLVPPLQVGFSRVQAPTNLTIIQTKKANYLGTTFILTWLDVVTQPVDHYNIYAIIPSTNQTYSITSANKSPASINILQPAGTTVRFIVQTVLTSGLTLAFNICPSTSGTCLSSTIVSGTIPVIGSDGTLQTTNIIYAPPATGFGVTPSGNGNLQVEAGLETSLPAKVGGTLFDHFADVGSVTTGETNLYSDTIPANTLFSPGDKLLVEYAGQFVGSATATRELRVYFSGSVIFDSGTITSTGTFSWNIKVIISRQSNSVVRCSTVLSGSASTTVPTVLSNYIASGTLLSLSKILLLTGQAGGAGAATNDITASLGTVIWMPGA